MENDAIWPVNTIVRNKKQGTMAIVIPANCPPRPDVTQLQTIGVDRPWVMNALTAEWEVVWQPERQLPDGISKGTGECYWHVSTPNVWIRLLDGQWRLAALVPTPVTVETFKALIELME